MLWLHQQRQRQRDRSSEQLSRALDGRAALQQEGSKRDLLVAHVAFVGHIVGVVVGGGLVEGGEGGRVLAGGSRGVGGRLGGD